jgi:membrane protein
MNIKKIVVMCFLIIHLGAFTATTTNALLDAQNAEKNNKEYNQIRKQNQEANDDPVLFNVGNVMSAAAGGASLYNLAMAAKGISSSTLSNNNDTSTNPSTWKNIRLKWWEVILVAIFMARELREVGKGNGSNAVVNDAEFERTPIGQIKNTSDIRTKIVMNLFKVTGNITDKVGKSLSNMMAVFMLLMGTLEILIGILKEITSPDTEEQKTILMVVKDMFPQITVMMIMVSILANGIFWNFYTGPLFNFSMKLGGMLAGKSFNMNDLPDYLTKLFNVPFKVILTAVKMLFSVKGVMNNINPMLILLSGMVILWMSMKAAIEIMTVLVDYLLIGCFAMVTMIFIVFGTTKNIGLGAIGGVIAAMVNIIVMFALIGYAFQYIEKLNGDGSSDISKLLGMIAGVFVVYGLLKQIKTIGNALNSGSAAFIDGSSITNDVVASGFNIAITGKFMKGGLDALTKKEPAGERSLGRTFKEVIEAATKNVQNAGDVGNTGIKKKNLSEMKTTTTGILNGESPAGEELLQRWFGKKDEENKNKKKENDKNKNDIKEKRDTNFKQLETRKKENDEN